MNLSAGSCFISYLKGFPESAIAVISLIHGERRISESSAESLELQNVSIDLPEWKPENVSRLSLASTSVSARIAQPKCTWCVIQKKSCCVETSNWTLPSASLLLQGLFAMLKNRSSSGYHTLLTFDPYWKNLKIPVESPLLFSYRTDTTLFKRKVPNVERWKFNQCSIFWRSTLGTFLMYCALSSISRCHLAIVRIASARNQVEALHSSLLYLIHFPLWSPVRRHLSSITLSPQSPSCQSAHHPVECKAKKKGN